MANKKEIIDKMAEISGLKKQDTSKALDSFVEAVQFFAEKDEKVQLLGFGTFEVRERAERKGRNPHTGEAMTIEARKTLSFKQGKSIKKAINK